MDNSSFVPDELDNKVNIPFFDDVCGKDGWKGHTTTKSIDTLKSEVFYAINRLGGKVLSCLKGTFPGDPPRDGFQLNISFETPDGRLLPGRIEIAALPVKRERRMQSTLAKRREQSLKMALFMFQIALDGQYFSQALSPGYNSLMPYMLFDENRTLSQAFLEMKDLPMIQPGGDFSVEIVEE